MLTRKSGKLALHFQLAATFIGTVIGAGFASGQEMVQFFISHGRCGLWLTLVSGILFAFFGAVVLAVSSRWQVENYQQLYSRVFGRAGTVFDLLITLFIFMCFCIMVSASAALFAEHLNCQGAVGLGLTIIAILAALLRGISGVVWLNSLLIPLMFLLCFLVSGLAVYHGWQQGTGGVPAPAAEGYGGCVRALILYVSYNLLLATVVLASLKDSVKKAGGVTGGVIGGLLLGVFAFVIARAMVVFYPEILLYEVPMLYVAGMINSSLKAPYAILLWFALLTTALATGYGFSQRLAVLLGVPYRLAVLGTVAAAIPLAQYRFSYLVATVYPLFGYIGLVFLLLLLWRGWYTRR